MTEEEDISDCHTHTVCVRRYIHCCFWSAQGIYYYIIKIQVYETVIYFSNILFALWLIYSLLLLFHQYASEHESSE